MTAIKIEFDGPKRVNMLGWYRNVRIDGQLFYTGVERGKLVRIPFKPRGKNRGFRWHGFVRDAKGRTLWAGDVGGTIGCRGLLKYAGLLSSTEVSL